MGGFPTVAPPFLIESGHKNRETVTTDAIYRNVDPDLYQNWFGEKESADQGYSFEDEEIWPATQPADGNKENEDRLDIIEDEASDDDLSLPTVQQLATSVVPQKTRVSPSSKAPFTPSRQVILSNAGANQEIQKATTNAVNGVYCPATTNTVTHVFPNQGELMANTSMRVVKEGTSASQVKKTTKRKSWAPIEIDLDSDNERSKKKRGSKLSMAEKMYEAEKIDTEIQKRELELKIKLADRNEKERRELANRAEKKASRHHELVMLEVQERRVELQVQAAIRQTKADERLEEAKLRKLQFEML